MDYFISLFKEVKNNHIKEKDLYEVEKQEKDRENEILVENLQKVVGLKDQEIEQMKRVQKSL